MNKFVVRYRRMPLNYNVTRVAVVEAETGDDALWIVRDALLRAGEEPNDYSGWKRAYTSGDLGWSEYRGPPPGRIISTDKEPE